MDPYPSCFADAKEIMVDFGVEKCYHEIMIVESRLRTKGFSAFGGTFRAVGVYVLLRGEEVLYVGQSTNVWSRVGLHYSTRERNGRARQHVSTGITWNVPIPFTSVMVLWCGRNELNDLELQFIKEFKPPFNVAVREPTKMKISLDELMAAAGIPWDKLETRAPTSAPIRRRLAEAWQYAEKDFKATRDKRQAVTMPKLRFMEEA